MTTKRSVLIFGAASLALFVTGRIAVGAYAQSLPVMPITVTQRVVMKSQTNPAGRATRRAIASANGVTVLATRYETAFAATPGFHYRLMNFDDGRKIDVFDLIKATNTYRFPLDDRSLTVAKKIAAKCVYDGRRLLGEEPIGGIPAIKLGFASPSSEITSWVHLASGCTELQSIWIWKKGGVETARTENLLESATPGVADPDLPRIGTDYKEMLPSEAQASHAVLRFGSVEKALAAAKTAGDRQGFTDKRDDATYIALKKFEARTLYGYGPSRLWIARIALLLGLPSNMAQAM